MTHNVDREELKTLLFEEGWDLSTTRSYRLADHLLAKYDITEKPEPVGTVRVAYDVTGRDSVVYIKTSAEVDGWSAVYFGTAYEHPIVYWSGRTPTGATGRVFSPPSGS